MSSTIRIPRTMNGLMKMAVELDATEIRFEPGKPGTWICTMRLVGIGHKELRTSGDTPKDALLEAVMYLIEADRTTIADACPSCA